MITNFPNGVSSFGIPIIGAGPVLTTGNVFFVNSNHSLKADVPHWGRDPGKPFATLDYAVGRCSPNNGDFIIVAPGHAETVAGAGALSFDVAGISVIGLGNGNARPTITATATTSTTRVDAENVLLSNFLFTTNIDAVASPVVIAQPDCSLLNCAYRDGSGTQATEAFVVSTLADRLLVKDFVYDGATAAGTQAGFALVGCDDVVIDGLRMDGNFSVGGINIRGTAVLDLEVRNVWFRTRNAADIFLVDTITGSTGLIGPNLNLRLNDNAANITEAVTGATFVYFQPINVVNLAGEVAMQTNITPSTDA